jgi:hypothetical protein
MPKFETQAEFRARMRRIAGIPDRPQGGGRRVGDHIKFHCGDEIFAECDPRHTATVQAIHSTGTMTVIWNESGWRGEINIEDARRVK